MMPVEDSPDALRSLDSNNFDSAASPQDIFNCFRLLLGRHPSPAEWSGHNALAGNDLRSVVRNYLDSKEFQARYRLGQSNAQEISLSQDRDFVIYTSADDLAVGRHVAAGVFEPHVAAIFRKMIRPGMNVVDLGANIGFFTMLAAALVGTDGSVLAVEPNPLNVRLIEASRRANGFNNVTIAACGVGKELGILAFANAFSNGVTAPLGDMLTDIMAAQIVPCMPLQSLVPADRRIDFIKIDVEGAEYLALSAARELLVRWRPVIASEFSPALLLSNSGISGTNYLEFFVDLGYQLSIIEYDGCASAVTIPEVIRRYETSGGDHIDMVFNPVA